MKDLFHDFGTLRYWRHFIRAFLSAIGAIAVVLGVWDVVFPGDVARHPRPIMVFSLLLSLVYAVTWTWPRPIGQTYSTPNTGIRVIRGDLFAQDGHIVVGTCDTFDTRIPDIIARNSVQGQMLERVFDGDAARLDQQVTDALVAATPEGTVAKEGKTARYPIGTVAVLSENRRKIFMVAYTRMSEQNTAHGSPDDTWRSLLRLWESVSVNANGGSVSMPVIGGGQSRLSQLLPAQDSIRFIAMSFMFASRYAKVCDELVIVVPEKQYHSLDRLQIQSFLRSLSPS